MAFLIQKFLRHPVFGNAVALYGVQLANLLLPLATVPFLSRVLGPERWGLVIFAQSFAAWMSIIIQYGFRLSATREIAQNHDRRDHIADVASGVISAQLMLSAVLGLASIGAYLWVPTFHRGGLLLLGSVGLSLALGLNPVWYFQGVERLRRPAAITVLGSALSAVGIFALVDAASSASLVIFVKAGGAAVTSSINLLLLAREVPIRRPGLKATVGALRRGLSMFLFQGSVSLYTSANEFMLGLLATPAAVSFFGSANRLSRAALGMISPLSNALYPRMNRLVVEDSKRASRVMLLTLIAFFVGGSLGGLMIAWLAPWLVHVVLGKGYETAIPVLRILAALLPIVALSNVLGIQWMLPHGMDRPFNGIIMSAGAFNILLAVILAPHFGAIGMAIAVVVSEGYVTLAMVLVVGRQHLTHGGSFEDASR